MASTPTDSSRGRTALFGWLWTVVVLGIGLWLSLATGEWIALLCAAGLVILPIGGLALRSRQP